MEQKKPTNAQLQRRIDKAVIHIDRTKNVRDVFFDDKGLRLVECEDVVIVSTNFHQHVFYKVTSGGYSKPCLYISRMIDFALDNDCIETDENGEKYRSFEKLIKVLEEKENRDEYYIARYVDWYLFNIFCPLYQIDENAASNFRVYFEYIHNLACNNVFLSEHKDGLTNKQYFEEYKKMMEEFIESITESQILVPEKIEDEIEALTKDAAEKIMTKVNK